MIKCKASVEALSVIIVVESLMATEVIMTGSVNVRAESAIYVINRLLILDHSIARVRERVQAKNVIFVMKSGTIDLHIAGETLSVQDSTVKTAIKEPQTIRIT